MFLEILLKYWKPLAVVLVAVVIYGAGWFEGSSHTQAKWDKEKAEQVVVDLKEETRQAEETVKVITRYVDRVRVVKQKADTLIKEVPVYVTEKSDSDCVINNGFVRVHDAAVTSTLPGSARVTDENASGIALSAVASTVVGNYGLCAKRAEQIAGLQDYIKSVLQKRGSNDMDDRGDR